MYKMQHLPFTKWFWKELFELNVDLIPSYAEK